MAIVLQTEKKNVSTWILYTCLYVILGLGAVTMVYPFLLMVSGSMKSRVDVQEMDIIPRFLYDDEMLFKKVVESKFNEDLQLYVNTSSDHVRDFSSINIPASNSKLVDDWKEFLDKTDIPLGWFLTAYGPTLEGKVIQKNELAFREHLQQVCGNDLKRFREEFNEPIENWFYLKFKPERLTDRKYQVASTRLMEEFYKFKSTLPLDDRIVVSCSSEFKRFVKLSGKDESAVSLTRQSKNPFWEDYVRDILHPQFVTVKEAYSSLYRNFLKKKYLKIEALNNLYITSFKSFNEVNFPKDKLKASAALTDYLLFIADRKSCPISALSIETPEHLWHDFLMNKYTNIDSLKETHGTQVSSFNQVVMPQKEMTFESMDQDTWKVRKAYMLSNFAMVLDFILYYGDGVTNTIIYCLLSIALSLLVNPMAAYALSRYKLPSQYKILLFLIATMAFPAVVTMIPNFLLLRDLGLLNTFSALLLPSMANGYSIFLLKGFFDSLPQELFEAAEIDGATEYHKFWIITMNLSKPILAVIALGAFNAAYSNFMFAFILCQDKDMWTLMVWLYQLQQFSSQGVVFASLLVAAVPTLLVYILCQNVIIRGIVVPTEK